MTRRRALRALLAAPLIAGGCAAASGAARSGQAPTADELPLARQARLAGVPFFAQRDYECGPAALAMAMSHAGVPVAPETLVPEVWIPARRGALQAEMLAAPRRRGLLATRLRNGLDAPLDAVAGGVPAIVFQNLGLSIAPVWHYAVLIGYDLAAETVLLHTGVDEAVPQSLHVFERTWVRGGSWAMAVTPAQRLPAGTDEDALLRAAAALERVAPAAAAQTWEALFERFPDNRVVLLGRGNAAWALGERARARAVWQYAVERHPDFADAWNNLAHALSEAGDTVAAREAAKRAVALGGVRADAYRQTFERVVVPSRGSPKLPMP
ncbi:MAG TPA: PA2778 family cysteine peptidase [Burkholderiaceae bacterium]|nr:PA2778 family cysteine peptidase [Burkholderiaceae bacterium]